MKQFTVFSEKEANEQTTKARSLIEFLTSYERKQKGIRFAFMKFTCSGKIFAVLWNNNLWCI